MKIELLSSSLLVLGALCWTGLKVDDPVAASIASPDRLESDLARDAERQPQRILDFFDIKRGMHVADCCTVSATLLWSRPAIIRL